MLVCFNEMKLDFMGFFFAFASTSVFVAQNIFSKKLFNQAESHSHSRSSFNLDKLNILFNSSFLAFVLMIPLWLHYESFKFFDQNFQSPSTSVLLLFLLNGFTNFAQCLIAFSILSLVSPITYSIASLFKRIFVIVLSLVYFGSRLRIGQVFGIILTFIGLYLYDGAKREVAKGEARVAAIQEQESSLPTMTRLKGAE